MHKTFLVAVREFKSTVMTMAFFFGAVILPVIVYGLMFYFTSLEPEIPQLKGAVAIVDATGVVEPVIQRELDPETIRLQQEQYRQSQEMLTAAREAGTPIDRNMQMQMLAAGPMISRFMSQPLPDLTFESIEYPETEEERTALLDSLRQRVLAGELTSAIVLAPQALAIGAQEQVTVYTGPKLHADNADRLKAGVSVAVVKARLAEQGQDYLMANAMVQPPSIDMKTVTDRGEAATSDAAAMLVPLAFMMLLWICTMTGGQYLLTSTVEEKSNRVMEVLLSAASPRQLMEGKIIGQGAVALLMLLLYAAPGIWWLGTTEWAYLIDLKKVLIVTPYFIMAFFFVACAMAAVGAAVTEMREAQALMGPVVMVLMLPLIAFVPIIRGPNAGFATVMSFIPPMTPFVMAMRLGSNQPIPLWQIIATLILGFLAVGFFIWVTAKIFRIGILMYGKPPSVRTLLHWVRMA